jgi:hypothetical protein
VWRRQRCTEGALEDVDRARRHRPAEPIRRSEGEPVGAPPNEVRRGFAFDPVGEERGHRGASDRDEGRPVEHDELWRFVEAVAIDEVDARGVRRAPVVRVSDR